MAAKQLWEKAIVPSLPSGASTWVSIAPEAEARCQQLQELCWRGYAAGAGEFPQSDVECRDTNNEDETEDLEDETDDDKWIPTERWNYGQ